MAAKPPTCPTFCPHLMSYFPVLIVLVWERSRSRSVVLVAGTMLLWRTMQALLSTVLPQTGTAGATLAALDETFLAVLLSGLSPPSTTPLACSRCLP